ncbi:MAG: ribonuclease HII [Rubricoccaceae bacterium]|nr:ribonuclease HII [Rubricoccaceae bacterium]
MPSLELEWKYWQNGLSYVVGVDEAGRGCLAGPVVAAAVVFPLDVRLLDLDDSKRLTAPARENLVPQIYREAIGVGVGACSPDEIDEMNILNASLEAMSRAVFDLPLDPDIVLVDGNQTMKRIPFEQKTVVRGDSLSLTIAAASVVAKVTRDRLMVDLDTQFPMYGWSAHKGYPTERHYLALAEHGPSPHHRRSFKLVR